MANEFSEATARPWRRSKIYRSPEGREWIEIENDDRMVCEISNQYLAIAHIEKEDEDIADLIITAVNSYDALRAAAEAALKAIGAPIAHPLAQEALHLLRAALHPQQEQEGK